MLLVLGVAGATASYYCWKVTGSPLQMPQQVNRDTYAVARYFYWQTAYPEHEYHHQAIGDFYGLEVQEFEQARKMAGVIRQTAKKIGMMWGFYLYPLLTLPLFWLPRVIRDQRIRLLLVAGAAGFLGSVMVVFFNIHYVAPIVPVIVAVVVQCMRHMRVYRLEGRPIGLFLVRAIVVMCVLLVPVQVRILASAPQPGTLAAIAPNRAAIEAQLRALPAPQLVLVRYGLNHDPLRDWVYNGADINHAKVIWARDMGPAENEELLRYYKDRRVWLLEADEMPPKLTPYSCRQSGQLVAAAQRATEPGGDSCR